jgi:hypothetical protein
MVSIVLPDSPKDLEFEEFISAFFHSGGYYIERNIIEKDIESVLELDIITTNYNQTIPDVQIFEVKSGEWGFQDIFKIRGWMDYLKIPKAGFIAHKERRNIEFLQKRAKSLDVTVVVVSDLNRSKEVLSEIIGKVEILDIDIITWRFSYWVERNLLKHLKKCKKAESEKKCYKNMDDYLFDINSGVFFTENLIEKAIQLYEAYQKYPHISAKCGNELIGNDFDEECKILPLSVFKETFYKCDYTDIQISTFIEHRARLAVLKSAIDFLLYKNAGIIDKIKEMPIITFKGPDFQIEITSFDSLPLTFRQGLEKISTHKFFNRYPVFWQWFIWIFGGFILKDYEKKEYQLLSQKTGIPVEEIPNALDSYQLLFPVDDGWFMDLSHSNIRVMKMFPVPFMGVGANYRRFVYTLSRKFDDLQLTGMHTRGDLSKWNNLTIKVLEES